MFGSQKQTKKPPIIPHLSALGRNLYIFQFRSFSFSQKTSMKYNKKSALALPHQAAG